MTGNDQRHVPPLATRDVPVDDWRDAVREQLGAGDTFVDLHAAGDGDGQLLRATFARGAQLTMLSCPAAAGRAASIVDLVPAARWDEREAAEHAGLRFDGHDTVPLCSHDAPLERWTTPVVGADTHQVAVGPIHAGIIESGHFRFHVVGERILQLDLRLFYKHRGLERAAEGRTPEDATVVAARACAACSVANSVAYALATEQVLGLVATEPVARARTLLLELERCYNHLHDLAAACAGVGFAPGNTAWAELKERAQRINHELTGHRFCFDTVRVGGSDLDLAPTSTARMRSELRAIGEAAQRTWRETLFNTSVLNRLRGVGHITRDDARQLGVVGPAARASGIAEDARLHSPQLAYPGFRAARLDEPEGDVRSRVELRALELPVSLAIIDALLAGGITPDRCREVGATDAIGAAIVESPRGRTFCSVEHDAGRVRRMRLRTSSYANWPAVAVAATGEILPEFPLVNKSFELCYACCDR